MSIDYKVGDTITYNTFGFETRTVVVTAKHENVKNGEPGFDGYVVSDPSFTVWGYDSQITKGGELMHTIRTYQTVTAVCAEENVYESPLTVDEIKKAIAEEDGIEVSEVPDSDVLEWLENNAKWSEGEVGADEITYRDNDSIEFSEEGE